MRDASRILVWSSVGIIVFGVVIVLAGLLVAKAAPLAEMRRSVAELFLTYLLEAPVQVSGDVEVNLWPRLEFKLDEIAQNTGNLSRWQFTGLAQKTGDVSRWRFIGLTLAFGSYWRLIFDPSLEKVELKAGRMVSAGGDQTTRDEETGTVVAAIILTTPSVLISDFHLARRDPVNGWSVEIEVSRLSSTLSEDSQKRQIEIVSSVGHKNIQLSADVTQKADIGVDGNERYDATISVSGDNLIAELRGSASTAKFDRDLDLQIEVPTFELGDVLDAVGLERAANAAGTLRAHLAGDPQQLAIRSSRLDLRFSSGEHIHISGSVEDIWTGTGFNLDVAATAPDDANSEDPPSDLDDIRFNKLRGKLSGKIDSFRLRDFFLETTLFDETIGEIGPIGVGAIARTPEGRLALRNVRLQAGPLERPWVRLAGSVGDAIQFRDVDLNGKLDFDLDSVLGAVGGSANTLGRLTGNVALKETSGALAVTQLTAEVRGSELWSMSFARDTPGQPELSQTTFSTSVLVPSFSRLAKVFGWKTRFSGPLSFAGRFLWSGAPAIDGKIAIGKSLLTVALAGTSRDSRSFLSGKLSSSRVDVDKLYALATTEITGRSRTADVDRAKPGLKVHFAVSPLALFDAEVQINADRLRGSGETVSGIDARVTLVKGLLSADPISMRYAGGQFRGAVSIDAQRKPAAVRFKGSAAGWNLADLVREKDAGFPVAGRLSASFDLEASLRSLAWAAQPWNGKLTLNVRNGKLGTNLLDWAGLGIWRGLFSAPALKGESVLRCVRAPFLISGGSIRTAPVIELETDHVRVVGYGTMNVNRDRINLYFEPRPLDDPAGDPTYPFVIKGRLADPAVEVTSARGHTTARRYAVRSCQPGKRRQSITSCQRFAKSRARSRSALFGHKRSVRDLISFGLAGAPDYEGDLGSIAHGARATTSRKRIYQEAMRECLAGRAGQF